MSSCPRHRSASGVPLNKRARHLERRTGQWWPQRPLWRNGHLPCWLRSWRAQARGLGRGNRPSPARRLAWHRGRWSNDLAQRPPRELAAGKRGTGMANQITYQVVEGWEQLPKGFAHRDVAGVAVDQEDRVFLICRGEHPVIVYD